MCCTAGSTACKYVVLSAAIEDALAMRGVHCRYESRTVISVQYSSSGAGDDFYLAVFLLLALALHFDSLKSGQQDGEVLSHSDEFAGEDEAVFCAEMDTSYVNVSLEPPLEAALNLRRGTLVV